MQLKRHAANLFLALATVAVFAACGTSSASENDVSPTAEPTTVPTPVATLPAGWSRVQVSEGMLGRDSANPYAGFTIDLPPGWTTGQTGFGADGPRGWIAGEPYGDEGRRPTLSYLLGGGFKYNFEQLSTNFESDVRRVEIGDQQAILHLAEPEAIDLGPQVGIYFDRIPGGETADSLPSLSIDGDSRGFNDQELLAQVLSSVRYEEIGELQELPTVSVVPGNDWQRAPARDDFNSFSMLLAPGWVFESRQGIDSLVGVLTDGEIVVYYDFGGFAGSPYSEISRVRDGYPNPAHEVWSETLEAGSFGFVRPVSDEPDPNGTTGVFVSFEPPPVGDDTFRPGGYPNLSFSASELNRVEQDTLLAMLRTAELEPDTQTPKR